jgi:hypothetical protein
VIALRRKRLKKIIILIVFVFGFGSLAFAIIALNTQTRVFQVITADTSGNLIYGTKVNAAVTCDSSTETEFLSGVNTGHPLPYLSLPFTVDARARECRADFRSESREFCGSEHIQFTIPRHRYIVVVVPLNGC